MVSESKFEVMKDENGKVLILVLVEDGLGVCGRLSQEVWPVDVLILVLVEDGLGVLNELNDMLNDLKS